MLGNRFRKTILCLCAAPLLAAAPGSAARTYKWVDENGVTHYSQTKPHDRKAQELTVRIQPRPEAKEGDDCTSLICRAERLGYENGMRKRARQEKKYEQQRRDAAAKAAAGNQVFPQGRLETTSEKVERLVAACKASRGAKCDSDEEKRRMFLKNVELTQQERRSLQYLSPADQRRVLERRIPQEYRTEENSTESYFHRELRSKYGTTN